MGKACVATGDACVDEYGADACCDEGNGVTCITPLDFSQATCQTCAYNGDSCTDRTDCCTDCCNEGVCVSNYATCNSEDFSAEFYLLGVVIVLVMAFLGCLCLTACYQFVKSIGVRGESKG